jgi:hypothetical protein
MSGVIFHYGSVLGQGGQKAFYFVLGIRTVDRLITYFDYLTGSDLYQTGGLHKIVFDLQKFLAVFPYYCARISSKVWSICVLVLLPIEVKWTTSSYPR